MLLASYPCALQGAEKAQSPWHVEDNVNDPELEGVTKRSTPYAPLAAIVGGGSLGEFTDVEIAQIASTWSFVNSHGGMLDHHNPAAGTTVYWAGPSAGRDRHGRTIGERIKAINPAFVLSNYRNGSYIAQHSPHEAAEVEARLPLGISVWNTGVTLLEALDAEASTVRVTRYPDIPTEPATREGRPDFYPWKKSTTRERHSKNTREYVAWLRVDDEVMRIDDIQVSASGVTLQVQRGLWGTTAVGHAKGATLFQPIYIGRNTGIDHGDNTLGGRPDDPSKQPGIRYALITAHPEMHRWLGDKAELIFAEGYDVCWLDVSVSTWYNNANAYGDSVRPWNLAKGQLLTQDDYREWQQLKNDALYARFPRGKFWINNVKGSVYFEDGNDRYQLSGENGHHPVDGGSMEMYAATRGNEEAWKLTANMTLDFVSSGFSGVAWSKGRDVNGYRLFSYATYLLAYRPGAALYFAIGQEGSLLKKPRNLLYWDLGSPKQTFKKIEEAESKQVKGLYVRDFTKGKVVVNPGSSAKTIVFEQDYLDVATGQKVRRRELPRNSAAILLLPEGGR